MEKVLAINSVRYTSILGCVLAFLIMTTFSGSALAEKINLNSADAEALEYIPGIGPAKSKEIIALRSASEGFKSVEELLAVPGIGEKTLQVILRHGVLDGGVSTLTDEMRQNPPQAPAGNSG
ncbi:MAG: ComEA family DNA-binding protein [bacterium]